jgi:hypothetical protein
MSSYHPPTRFYQIPGYVPTFTAEDIDAILVVDDGTGKTLYRFTPAELRREIDHAGDNRSLCLASGQDDDMLFWDELEGALKEAMDMLLYCQPKPAPWPGRNHIDVQSVKAHSDIVAVAERYTKLHKSGPRLVGKCPLHESKGSPLTVYPDQQTWHCYHCDKGGDVLSMVMKFGNVDFRAAVEALR